MANLTSFSETVKTKKAFFDVLEQTYDYVVSLRKDFSTKFDVVEKNVQGKDWRTGELLWEDEEKTIPKLEDKWGTIEIPREELDESQLAHLDAIDRLLDCLDSLV